MSMRMITLAGAFAVAAALTFAAGTSAQAQAGGVGAGPMNSKSAITGQSGRKGVGRMKSRRGMMKRSRSRVEVEQPRGAVVGAA